MEYPLAKPFQALKTEGLQKVVSMFKLALKEMPRLQAAFLDPKQQDEARKEILWLFEQVKVAMDQAKTLEKMDEKQLFLALNQPGHFTPEEWAALGAFSQLFQRFGGLLFHPPSKPKQPKLHFPKA
jgi:hypothetical protein